jgi:adenylate cyclase, class 2
MSAPPLRHNLERKCRHDDLESARAALQELPAVREGAQVQADVYYHARQGRLKLRRIMLEGNEAVVRAELIWYDRPDTGAIRASSYHRVVIADSDALHAALTEGLGVRQEVRKKREVWHWHNVRIHLDAVEGLGNFIEFEAVVDDNNDEAISFVRLEALSCALGLSATEDVACGYAELLEGTRSLPGRWQSLKAGNP